MNSITHKPQIRKKLIEVALPLEAINIASAREKSIRHGHPSTLHLWWARRPLASARAVIFSQMVDDPSEYLDVLRGDAKLLRKAKSVLKERKKIWDEAKRVADLAAEAKISAPAPGPEPELDEILAEIERERLFEIIRELVLWENTTNEAVLQRARDAIWESWRRTCAENVDHPKAKELFDRNKLPAFHDPFAGGGALPLEAQRLGLESYASDLNPVAVLINMAMIEIPPKFAGKPPVNPEYRSSLLGSTLGTPASVPAGMGTLPAQRLAAPVLVPTTLGTPASVPASSPEWHSRGYLPHRDKTGLIQFITFRLHDSVPSKLIKRWKAELGIGDDCNGNDPEFSSRLAELHKRLETYEDAGHGSCLLRNPQIAKLVEEALLHFDGQHYHLLSWCIMPNHVHILAEPMAGYPLMKIVHSWKSYTAHQTQKLFGHKGALWMREYYDRFIRNSEHLHKTIEYIDDNPVKAGLVQEKENWEFGSCRKLLSTGNAGVSAGHTGNAGLRAGTNRKIASTEAGAPSSEWKGAQGLAEDVRYYGQWMRDEAEKRIGYLYPKLKVIREKDGSYRHATTEEITNRKSPIENLTVIAWLWARTVKSPNPAFLNVDVPLASSFMLSTKAGKEAWVEPIIEGESYRFEIRNAGYTGNAGVSTGKDENFASTEAGVPSEAKNGTKLSRGANFKCIMSGIPISPAYIKSEGMAGRMGAKLMAIVAEGNHGRVYLAPTPEHEEIVKSAKPKWWPETQLPDDPRNFWTVHYGLTHYADLFTLRQLVALTTFSALVQEAREKIRQDGTSQEYANAVSVYLGLGVSKLSDSGNSLISWKSSMDQPIHLFTRQAIPMVWDFAEPNMFGNAMGDIFIILKNIARVLDQLPACSFGNSLQGDAQSQSVSSNKLVSTDPPYYDNIGYADLSDFFYIWLRCSLKEVYPDLFSTLAVPKAEELVATPYRHGGKEKAEKFFLEGMTQAMHRLAEQSHPAFPVTIYYAFKQAETTGSAGVPAGKDGKPASAEAGGPSTVSTGWETFLDAVLRAGFAITGTWPMRTELGNRMIGKDTNALASSIVLVCRRRSESASSSTRREFHNALKAELPLALLHLQRGNIAPVDLAQAAIGPGMGVFTRYAKVLDAEGKALTVREALALINQTLDETLAEQEGDFDPDTRWALTWFEQSGFDEGEYGVAEQLSKSKNTSVAGMVAAGILHSKSGKVRLLRPEELPADWTPESDTRLTVWEMVHFLVRDLGKGEIAAATLVAKLGAKAETARELAYRLYAICERRKRAAEALSYNALVQSWPEVIRLAQSEVVETEKQGELGL